MGIQILLIFLILSTVHASQDCPSAYCNLSGPLIKFPFWLQGTQSQNCAPPGFNLSCNGQRYPILHIPGSGDLYVYSIYYFIRSVKLEDVQGCLPMRLLSLNLSSTPYVAVHYRNYTFFRCPKGQVASSSIVECASTATSDIFATGIQTESLGLFSKCNKISTVPVPVSSRYDYGLPAYLDLTWNVPDCQDCGPAVAGGTKKRSDSSSHPPLFIVIPILFVLLVIAGCVCRMRQHNHPSSNSFQISEVGGLTGRGLNQHTIETYKKITIGESRVEDVTCSICLADYAQEDTIRFIPQCEHCFHVECIDKWLSMSRKCPICRVYLPNAKHAAQ